MTVAERRAVISGIGQSAVGRRLGRDELDLTIDAALEAITDARLTVEDIDGLATYPGSTGGFPGFSGPGSPAVQDALRLSVNWHSGGMEGPAQLQAVVNAVMAVSMGLARHVLVYRTVTEATAQGSGGRQGIGVEAGPLQAPVSGTSRSGRIRRPTGWRSTPSATCTSSAPPSGRWPRSPSTGAATPASTRRPCSGSY